MSSHPPPTNSPSPLFVSEIGPVRACPDCDSHDFLVHEIDDLVVFQCLACLEGWTFVLGFLRRRPLS